MAHKGALLRVPILTTAKRYTSNPSWVSWTGDPDLSLNKSHDPFLSPPSTKAVTINP